MSVITQQTTAVTGSTITAAVWNNEFSNILNDYNGGITNANISASAAIALSKLATGAIPTGLTIADANVVATADIKLGAIEFVIDGGGDAITTGIKGDLEVPFDCTITQATALADQSGSIVVDVWKDTYANFPPTNDDSITASAPVTISTATKSQDGTLTGWTTSVSAGDIIRFNVDSITTCTRVLISLKYVKV